jgi:ribose 5-phosphate isomerase B
VRGCAAVATDPYSIERSVLSNNCQVLCLGERVVAPMLAERVVQRWPGYGLDESSLSARKADLISECE